MYIYGSVQWTIHTRGNQFRYLKKTSLPSPFYIGVSVLSQEVSDNVCVLEFWPCFFDFSLRFWNCTDSMVFSIFHFIYNTWRMWPLYLHNLSLFCMICYMSNICLQGKEYNATIKIILQYLSWRSVSAEGVISAVGQNNRPVTLICIMCSIENTSTNVSRSWDRHKHVNCNPRKHYASGANNGLKRWPPTDSL